MKTAIAILLPMIFAGCLPLLCESNEPTHYISRWDLISPIKGFCGGDLPCESDIERLVDACYDGDDCKALCSSDFMQQHGWSKEQSPYYDCYKKDDYQISLVFENRDCR